VRIRIIAGAGLAAAFLAAPAGDALAAERVTYSASVRVTGQLVVTFHGDAAAGCAEAFRCDVERSTLRWTPPSRGQLYFTGLRGRRLRGYVSFYGPDQGVRTLAIVQRSSADGTHICADASGQSFEPYSSFVIGRRSLRQGRLTLGLRSRPRVFGPLTASQLATRCGGPLPADFLPDLPTRRLSLRAWRRGPTEVDLTGSASFSAAGFAGTVQSTVALRVNRARVRVREARRRPARRESRRPPLRNLAVEYRLARMTGSIPIDVAAKPRTCDPLDACGLAGTLTVKPGPARGEAYVYAYGRVSRAALRRAVGLDRGPAPRKASVYGYVSWDRARGSVTSMLERNGSPACRDSAPLATGALDLRVRGRRMTARLGRVLGLAGELLQTRCPGPLLSDFGSSGSLAVGHIPRRALARKTLSLHLDRGNEATTSSYRLRSRPDLTVVLEREGVEDIEGPFGFVAGR
jgi:hypothetical protein